ncbi:hypothetical protein GPECTOR_10g1063 [Gonium pectorale]|uniref:Uncharacterized protein n=1 Tax=Gonium pectorale TaxID=33097 RepID=A0A150GRU3_GONPE|nr:hypothetical protein GPECTOR_10g1063 [Gonium pectorale]|eukprot:KXZ52040.1 hypothetical protein GPECTOR_10g1063 [Gonium pectorale]
MLSAKQSLWPGSALAGEQTAVNGGVAWAGASQPHGASSGGAAEGAKAGSKGGSGAAADDDDEETWLERITDSEVVRRLTALSDRIFQNYFVAVLMDVLGVLLFMFDIYTDALVVDALADTEHRDWMIITLTFILWHYGLMAVLVVAYLKRTTTKLNVLGLEEGDSGAAVLGWGRRYRWLLFVPVALPGVVLLDVAMLFTSILPIMFPRMFSNFSSFLSNYNFSRFFIEFVFESIPQTILQTYIYHQLAKSHLAGSAQQRTVAMSLAVSGVNCLKYGWKLYKAADDAGLTLGEYFKYLLLLKGNYECSPSAMITVINECCAVRKEASLAAGAGGAGAGGAAAGGYTSGAGAGDGAGGSGETVFIMNGFHLHRNKSQYGPAQQAYILLNAFDRMDGCPGVKRWVVSGCPLASMNRILEKGIRAFKNLTSLEVNECSLRGDTWKLVTRAIKRHKNLEKVKLIQTGILPKYRNAKRLKVVAGLFKHSLKLRTVALCLHWWDEHYLQDAVDLYLLGHPTLESLAIELPPGAVFAARDHTADPRVAGPEPRVASRQAGQPHHHHHHADGRHHKPGLDPIVEASLGSGLGAKGHGFGDTAATHFTGTRSSGGRPGGGFGTASFARPGSAAGAASGFLSPFATDASAAAAAAASGSRHASGGGGLAGSGGSSGISAAVLGWIQYGGDVLSDAASYISDGTVSTMHSLAAVATGRAWDEETPPVPAGAASVASARYCWLLASVISSAPALQSLYIHNHALPPSAPDGVGQLAAALAGNTRLTALSLRGSTVGDAGAAALARVLAGHNSCLRSLNLRRCQLHDEGVAALCACLVENRGLRTLDLSHNRVQGLGVGVVAASAATGGGGSAPPSPLHHAPSGPGRLAGLERALRLNTGLTELRLEGWRDTFDDPHAVSSLATALAANQGLKSLSLAGCCISTAGATALAAALAANSTLTSLNLNAHTPDGGASAAGGGGTGGGAAADVGLESRIGDAGCAALGSALARNRTLRELFLAGCVCGAHGGAALGEALRQNTVLQLLDMSGEGVGRRGGEAEGRKPAGIWDDDRGGEQCGEGGRERASSTAMGVDGAAATYIFTALQSQSPTPKAASAGGGIGISGGDGDAGVETRPLSRRFGRSASSLLARAASYGTLAAAGGGQGSQPGTAVSVGGGEGDGEAGLSEEAREVVGAMWSALAGGLAANTALRVLRLAHCGLGPVGAAALAPALLQNACLRELDMSGLPAATARAVLAAVIARAAAAAAVGAAGGHGFPHVPSNPSVASAAAAAAGSGGAGCGLRSILATDASYEVVDLLGADKVTSRAAEEAAAALEEAMRAPSGWSPSEWTAVRTGSLLRGGGRPNCTSM